MIKRIAYLCFSLLLAASAYPQSDSIQPWPLKTRIDLSSGFGDMRLNRFHAGVDIRTGGVDGQRVYSPVSGCVWRVKMSYNGYGKGIYVKGDDDHFYVFAHLSELAEPIERPVQRAQFEAERYYVDLYFPEDSIRVEKGSFLGLTGQTGAGAPHLHFEKRSPDNRPLNPLMHGFELGDKVRPTFERIGFHLRDDRSLFSTNKRKLFLPVKKTGQPGKYRLDTLIHLTSPFGILVHCYDQMRQGSMRQSIQLLELYFDTVLYYRSEFDTLVFEIGHVVDLSFDPVQAARGEKRVRRLYHKVGQDDLVGQAFDDRKGEFGWDQPAFGPHRGLVRARDSFGNESRLNFEFVWCPPDDYFSVDTTVIVDDSTTDVFIRPNDTLEQPEFIAHRLRGEAASTSTITELENNWLKVRRVSSDSTADLTLVSRTDNGCKIATDIVVDPGYAPKTNVEILEGGVIADNSFFSTQKLRPCDLSTIDKLVGKAGLDDSVYVLSGASTIASPDGRMGIKVDDDTFYEPRVLGIFPAPDSIALPSAPYSSMYRLEPSAFPLRKPLDVSIKLDVGNPLNKHAGLCWLDQDENEWVWIDQDTLNDNLTAGESYGGGIFAAVLDTLRPTIRRLNIRKGESVFTRQPEFRFELDDNLSGFENDLSIDIRVDGEWLIPEYDNETKICKGTFKGPLKPGARKLEIAAVDRAGNRTELKRKFYVKEKSAQSGN